MITFSIGLNWISRVICLLFFNWRRCNLSWSWNVNGLTKNPIIMLKSSINYKGKKQKLKSCYNIQHNTFFQRYFPYFFIYSFICWFLLFIQPFSIYLRFAPHFNVRMYIYTYETICRCTTIEIITEITAFVQIMHFIVIPSVFETNMNKNNHRKPKMLSKQLDYFNSRSKKK